MYSQKYILKNEEKLRNDIVEETKKWAGAKYHHLGMLDYKAADCMTLLIQVYSKVGIIDRIEPEYYPPDFLFHRGIETYLDGVSTYGNKVETYKPGNIILYKFGRVVSHSAIIIEYPVIIHAIIKKGVIFDDASQSYLKNHEHSIYSFWRT